jgi:hypothetical protein
MRINTSKVCLVKCSFGSLWTPVDRTIFFLVSSLTKIYYFLIFVIVIWSQFHIGKVTVIHCMIRLCNVCHNELFLPNLWNCRYHVYWNLLYPLSILKVIFDQYIKKLMRPHAVHFNELNGQPLHINDHIKYEN